MKPEFEPLELVKNDALKQFEMNVDGEKAFITFTETAHTISLNHTEVAPALEG